MKSIYMIMLLVSSLLIAGCQNTVHGFGKDMEKTGEEIQKSTNN